MVFGKTIKYQKIIEYLYFQVNKLYPLKNKILLKIYFNKFRSRKNKIN